MLDDHDDVETEPAVASVYGLCLEHGCYDEQALAEQLAADVGHLRRARDELLALELLREADEGRPLYDSLGFVEAGRGSLYTRKNVP